MTTPAAVITLLWSLATWIMIVVCSPHHRNQEFAQSVALVILIGAVVTLFVQMVTSLG